MSPFAIVMLVAGVVLIVAVAMAEASRAIGVDGRRKRERTQAKEQAEVVLARSRTTISSRAVERDLAALPTIDDRDLRTETVTVFVSVDVFGVTAATSSMFFVSW